MQTWKWDEATAISIGFEPFGPIDKIKNIALADTDVTTFYFKRRQVIGNNIFPFGDQTHLKLTPKAFCDWVVEVGLQVPEDLLRCVSKITGADYKVRRGWVEASDQPELENRERESLLKLVISLAVGGYGFQPTAIRSEIPNQIRSDMNIIGLDLHPDTIRRYLKEGVAILPSEAKEEQPVRSRRGKLPKAE